ncbi:MAG: MFS transporter [Proteobacteria bacterium]|nr:MFS transporter [Pseudomonadota bacterium]
MARRTHNFGFRSEMLGGLGRALASRDYRFYAAGHFAHVHGWWANRLGVGWLTWQLTESGAWLGIIAFAGMIPVMIVSPIGGALADRYGHRQSAIIAGAAGSVVTFTIALLALTGHITIPLLLILSILQGTIFGLDFPARQSLIPQLVGRANISAAIGVNSTSFQFGSFVGPIIAAFLSGVWGPGAPILLFGITTVWMVLMVMMISGKSLSTRSRNEGSILGDVKAGFRYLLAHPALRLLFLLSFTIGVLIRPFVEILPGFAASVFGGDEETLALLFASSGIGAFISAITLAYRGRTQGLTRIMLFSAVSACIGIGLFSITNFLPFALVALALGSMMMLAAAVGWQSLIQNIVEPAVRGRIISINAAIGVGAPALGALLMGSLADLIGFQAALATTAIIALILVAAVWSTIRRLTGEMEADPGY